MCLRISPPSMGQLSAKCGILNVSQFYGPPWPSAGLALLLLSACFLDLHPEDGVQTLHLQPTCEGRKRKEKRPVSWQNGHKLHCTSIKQKCGGNYDTNALSVSMDFTGQDMDVCNVLSSFCSITLVFPNFRVCICSTLTRNYTRICSDCDLNWVLWALLLRHAALIIKAQVHVFISQTAGSTGLVFNCCFFLFVAYYSWKSKYWRTYLTRTFFSTNIIS